MSGSFAIAVPLAVGPPLVPPDPVPPVEIPPHDFLWEPNLDPSIDLGPGGVDLAPGSIVSIKAGVYQGKSFGLENAQGAVGNRIIIRNDPFAEEPAIFEHTGDAFEFFRWLDCQEFEFDGTLKYVGAPAGQLGVSIVNGVWTEGRTQAGIIFRDIDGNTLNPTGYLKTAGSTQKCVFKGFELDGKGNITFNRSGIGFMAHDRFRFQKAEQYDLLFRDDIIIEKYYIHDTHHEAIYNGTNWGNDGGQGGTSGAALDADPRNCHNRYGIAEQCGWGGGQIKGAWDSSMGRSSIHHCASYRCGQEAALIDDFGHSTGLQMTGSHGDIYNCLVVESGGASIKTVVQVMDKGVGPEYSASQIADRQAMTYRVFNNLVIRNGENNGRPDHPDGRAYGINTPGIQNWHTTNTNNQWTGELLSDLISDCFNNTVIDGDDPGNIRYENSSGLCFNNICAGDGSGGDGRVAVGGSTAFNNLENAIVDNDFLDANNDDYHLTASSIAVDAGSSGFPTVDHVDTPRPLGAASDQGAFEFIQAPAPRNILGETTFAAGGIKSSMSLDADGVVRDAGFMGIGYYKFGAAITITNITNTNPAIATFIGSMPDPGIAAGSAYMDAIGFTLENIPAGMTQLSKHLIRAKNVSGQTFECWQDGDDNGVNHPSPNDVLGNTSVNAIGYGTWVGQAQTQAYQQIESGDRPLWWEIGSDDYPNMRVVTSITPPDTVEGSAQEVFPLEGNNFLSHQINYWIDHTRTVNRTDGVGQPTNKPRNQCIMQNSVQRVPDFETIWSSISVFLPTNFDVTSVTKENGDQSETQLMDWSEKPFGGEGGLFALHFQHGEIGLPNGEMGWVLDGAFNGIDDSPTENALLANVAADIGLWTTFIFKCRPGVSPNGIMQVWKSTGPYLGGVNPLDRVMTLVYDRTGQSMGFPSETGFWGHVYKQYKHGWHHGPTSPTDRGLSFEQWIGFDSIRWGTEESHGTSFADVHPFRRAQP